MSVQITLIGLNQIGASFGLALANAAEQIQRVGHDKDPDMARMAQKMGAVDKLVFTLPAAVENADVVILSLPADELRFTLEAIAPYLKPGCTVVDTSPIPATSTAWAQKVLPREDRYFVTLTPTVSAKYLLESDRGTASAQADLFKDTMMMITAPAGTDSSALTLAESLAEMLGAKPIFSDAVEVSGLLASSHLLPELLSAALVNATAGQPGWSDIRKIAGQVYARMTEPAFFFEEKGKLGQNQIVSHEVLVAVLDHFIRELVEMRDAIARQDGEALHARFEQARQARQSWWSQRLKNQYPEAGEEKSPGMPRFGESIGRLLGIRPKRD